MKCSCLKTFERLFMHWGRLGGRDRGGGGCGLGLNCEMVGKG